MRGVVHFGVGCGGGGVWWCVAVWCGVWWCAVVCGGTRWRVAAGGGGDLGLGLARLGDGRWLSLWSHSRRRNWARRRAFNFCKSIQLVHIKSNVQL